MIVGGSVALRGQISGDRGFCEGVFVALLEQVAGIDGGSLPFLRLYSFSPVFHLCEGVSVDLRR